MKNRFIKTLFIINGILIPLFILTLFGIFLNEYITSQSSRHNEIGEDFKTEYEVMFSSPNEIINSTNYYIIKYKEEVYELLLGSKELEIGKIPENTVNIIFLNKNFEKIRTLLDEDASISHMKIPNFFSKNEEKIKLTKNIIYLIGKEDSNNDGVLNKYDNHFLYISDLSGLNLKKILDKKIKEYKFINDFNELLITYYENENDLSIGVYDIDKKTFTKKSDLNNLL